MKRKKLIEKGFFPRQLPPPFQTKEFAEFYDKNESKLRRKEKSSRGIKYSCPRVGITRTEVVITNPAHQAPLFDFIAAHWNDIVSHYKKSTHSCSKPLTKGERAANLPSFKKFLENCFTESYYHHVRLKTDISNYYPSIYTHSIPWAIHTKPTAKADDSFALWGNELDKLVRDTQYKQTTGLPIGPDSSFIISELIGSSIDEYIESKFPDLVGYRFVDDMYYFFGEQGEAEVFMKEIRTIFKEFELKVNTTKTTIDPLPIGVDDEWVIKLRRFEFGENYFQQKSDLISFFSLAFEYSKSFPDKFILSYAIRRIQNERFKKEVFKMYESLLLKTIQIEPGTMPDVLRILLSYYPWVDKTRVKKAIEGIIAYSAERALDYELSWALWYAISFEIKLSFNTSRLLERIKDPVTSILILDALDLKLIPKKAVTMGHWKKAIVEDSLWDENWLIAYEISVHGWLLKSYDYIDKVPKNEFFKKLKKSNVKFYDRSIQLEKLGDLTRKPSEKLKKKLEERKKKLIESTEYDY